jgi:RNA polymerase sigma-70 factor (ECF subfamily)
MSQPANRVPVDAACAPDVESRSWLRALSATGTERADALERLHALLLRAARFEVARRREAAGEDLARQAADDALAAVAASLHSYRGDSRFTSWASKFALVETAVQLRRRQWQGRDLPPEADGWTRLLDGDAGDPRWIEGIHDAAVELLAPYERAVLVAITLNDVPIDVLAERRGMTRAAVYAHLHDARVKLRARLSEDGVSIARRT